MATIRSQLPDDQQPAASPASTGMGADDITMLGGVPSQRMDANFNAFSSRLMHQYHFSRLYSSSSAGAPQRATNFRTEASTSIGDDKTYGGDREQFIQSSDRSFNTGTNGILGSVEGQETSIDGNDQRIVNGNAQIANIMSTSARVSDWDGSDQAGGLTSETGYRDLEERDGTTSDSQSDGSDEDDEDGDIDGDGEDQDGVAELVSDGLPGNKVYENISSVQIDGVEGRHESLAGSMLGHADNNATQNGTMLVTGGLGTPSGYFREGLPKDATLSRDPYGKEGQNYVRETGRVGHTSSMHDASIVGTPTAETESDRAPLTQSSVAISQSDPGNQLVAFSHRRTHENMEMPLRSALTDPLTGSLMDDATILSCGHSFGSDSLQRVLENNACISCGKAARREDMAPNHALRLVVQAYRQEVEVWKENPVKSAKRRRERLEQIRHHSTGDLELSKIRGVQFPYKVNDKVLIKGNKRTPERFVGRNAVITTQCLNGWYVVRTLDNGESVKLQYRSLMKMDEPTPCIEPPAKQTGPNWL